MNYEIILNKYTLSDKSAFNALSIGFCGSKSYEKIYSNIEKALTLYPLTCSNICIEDGKLFFEKKDKPTIKFEKISESDKVWITKQSKIPFDYINGEFLRFALSGENNLIIYAHPVISDSRGLISFGKSVLMNEFIPTEFYFPNINDAHLNLLDNLKIGSLNNTLNNIHNTNNNEDSFKLKSICLKSDIIFRLCSRESVSLLSFFITTALSLNKTKRIKISVPICEKDNYDDILINDTRVYDFKRGFEPRLKFYDNAGEIDKLFQSIISKKKYLKKTYILSKLFANYFGDVLNNKKVCNYLHSDLSFDVLNTINDDDIIKTLSYYPSSSFVDNNFGICAVDNRITISTVLHNEKGENLFKDFQTTLNLLSKEALKQYKNLN